MWETDETCGAAYLLSVLLLLPCLLRGSAEGACEPRCLHPPSPPTRTRNKLRLYGTPLPGPSPLITLAPWIRYVPPRPHPHRLNKPAGSWFSSCRDASSPPHSPCSLCPFYTTVSLSLTARPPPLTLLFPELSLPSSAGVSFQCRKHPRIHARLSGALCTGRRGS